MTDAGEALDDHREVSRLLDEVEQLRTALEASSEEVDRLVEERMALSAPAGTSARVSAATWRNGHRDRNPDTIRHP